MIMEKMMMMMKVMTTLMAITVMKMVLFLWLMSMIVLLNIAMHICEALKIHAYMHTYDYIRAFYGTREIFNSNV